MSLISTIGLTLVYLAPVALIALLLGDGKHPLRRWLLTAVLIGLPVFYVAHYLLLQQIQGWPSTEPLPRQFRLLAFDITEPDPVTGRDGRILLWVKTANDDQPRVHQLNYRKSLHQELVTAGQRQAKGHLQIGTRGGPRNTSATSGPGAGSQGTIRFRDVEGPSLPPKQ